MSGNQPATPPFVFIGYAREDEKAAKTLYDGLARAGIAAWLDDKHLAGGDDWEKRIKEKIRKCKLFVAIVSATTVSRDEGYFRREWRMAIDRKSGIADDVDFLAPVSIDDTASNEEARVPDEFLAVQWTRLVGGVPTEDFLKRANRALGSTDRKRRTVKNEPLAVSASRIGSISSAYSLAAGELPHIVKFVVSGPHSLRLLIRGLGPAVSRTGLPNPVMDPLLRLYAGKALVAQCADWTREPEPKRQAIEKATDAVGAVRLHPGDAALLLELPPGAYTAVASSASGQLGNGVFELYPLDERKEV